MPIAVGPLAFKSIHRGFVSALCNILNITMSHDQPHDIINRLTVKWKSNIMNILYSCVHLAFGANYDFTFVHRSITVGPVS